MTPDKIYIRPQTNPNMLGGLWSGKPTKEATISYIRKEALMEWANKQKEEAEFHYNHADLNLVRVVAFNELIDKLNSM